MTTTSSEYSSSCCCYSVVACALPNSYCLSYCKRCLKLVVPYEAADKKL